MGRHPGAGMVAWIYPAQKALSSPVVLGRASAWRWLKCAECVRLEALCQSEHKAGRILPRRERRQPFPVRGAQGLRLERGRRRTVPAGGQPGH